MKKAVIKKICKDLCKKIVNLENTECVLCLNEIRMGTLLIPCNHYQLCTKCSAFIEKCPVCRENVDYLANYYKDNQALEDFNKNLIV